MNFTGYICDWRKKNENEHNLLDYIIHIGG